MRSERGFFGGAAGSAAAGVPGIAGRGLLGRLAAGPRVGGPAATEAAAGAARPRGLGDLGGGELQRRADFVDVELDARALAAVLPLVLTHAEGAGHDDTLALGQGLGHILGELTPGGAADEQRV